MNELSTWHFFSKEKPQKMGKYLVFDIFGNVEELSYYYSGAPNEPVSFCQGKIIDASKLVGWQLI